MKNERILSYKLSEKLSEEDLNEVTAAGSSAGMTVERTWKLDGSRDTNYDL